MKRTARESTNPPGANQPCRFVLLSPRARHPRQCQQVLTEKGLTTCFVPLLEDVTGLEAFLAEVLKALADQFPALDSRLGKVLHRDAAEPEYLAEALLADLKGVQRLVLDSLDRLHVDSRVARFMACLATGDAGDLQIVVNSRVLDRRLWGPLVADGRASVAGEETGLLGGILTSALSRSPQLEVYAFRAGSVFVDGCPITDWEGPLPRSLFLYLVDHPLVTRQEIFDTFWPGLSSREATNVFHVTKRKIAECLGLELTDYRAGFYRPSSQFTLHYDVAAFEAAAPSTETDFKMAIALHRAPFLYGVNLPWVKQRRRELQARYVELLIGLARLYCADDQMKLATLYYGRAWQQVPEREDLARELIALNAAQGDVAQAAQVFKQLAQTLKTRFDIQPSAQTQHAYQVSVGQA